MTSDYLLRIESEVESDRLDGRCGVVVGFYVRWIQVIATGTIKRSTTSCSPNNT
jgi:hypothetical protein